MLKCTLGDKAYCINYVKARALREIEEPLKAYQNVMLVANKAVHGEETNEAQKVSIKKTMEIMGRWFCLLFDDQFTYDELMDNYPADRIMHDMTLALTAVQSQMTEVLNDFPTTGQEKVPTKKKN